MEEVKKTRGAWVIHVREFDVEQSTDARCSPTPNSGEQRNMKDEEE